MPLLWLSLAFIIGLVVAGWARAPWPAWLAGAGIAFILTVIPWWKRPWPARRHPGLKFAPLWLLVFLALGGLRYELAHQPPTPRDLAYFNGRGPAEITAWVAEPPDQRDTLTLLRLRVEQAASPPESSPIQVRGQVLAVLPAGADWRYGDRLLLSGNPIDPPEYGDFSYRDYLARQGIYTYLAYPRVRQIDGRAGSPILAGIYALREQAHRVLTALFSPPEGPLLDGILLGLDRGLPADIEDAFRRTGTSHIIAISGFNMTILAGLFAALFGRLFSRWWAALAALLAIAAYTLLVGAGPAVVRAALMSGLALVAVQIGRSAGGLNALMLAAGGMCLFNPDLPWDVSFQLSFAATLGLLLYASRLEGALRGFAERRLPARWAGTLSGLVAENVLFTLVAQAFTLPVIIYHFGRVSLVAPLANALVLPVQAALMVLSGLAVLLGLLWMPLGQALAAPAWALAAYTLRVVGWLGGSPGAEWVVGQGGWLVPILAYAALLSLAFAGGWIKTHLPRLRPAVGLLLLGGLAIFLWRQALAAGDGRLHLVAANLDGQIAVLVRAPQGQSLLIAGGARASQVSGFLGRWLPPGAGLDALLLNGGGVSTLNALPEVLARFPAGAAYLTADLPQTAGGRALQQALAQRSLVPARLESGDALELGSGVRLSAPGCGSAGCALLLEMGAFNALIPAGQAAEPEMAPSPEVLLLSTADLDAQPVETWRQVYAPAYILSPKTLPPGAWVHLQTDGVQLWMEQGD